MSPKTSTHIIINLILPKEIKYKKNVYKIDKTLKTKNGKSKI